MDCLYRFQVGNQVFYPDVSPIHVLLNLMKDRSPDRHLARPVRSDHSLAHNDPLHPRHRKISVVANRDYR